MFKGLFYLEADWALCAQHVGTYGKGEFFFSEVQQLHAFWSWVSMLRRWELAWWLSNAVPRANYMMHLLPRQESLQAAYFRLALSWFRKASLYERLKPTVNFQSVEAMLVHTTLSASLLQVVVWLFPCLPSTKTLSNEAQNCNLSLALLVCFTSSYLEILLIWEQLLAVHLQFLVHSFFLQSLFGTFAQMFSSPSWLNKFQLLVKPEDLLICEG